MKKTQTACTIQRAACLAALFLPTLAQALYVVDQTVDRNSRFLSGFPANPVLNTSASFRGAGYDFSGTAWTIAWGTKGYAMLSPRHCLAANHFGGGSGIEFRWNNGLVGSQPLQDVSAIGYGIGVDITNDGIANPIKDIAVLRVVRPVANAGAIARNGVLDLHAAAGKDTITPYQNLPVFIYGHGGNNNVSPKIGETTISSGSVAEPSINTPRTSIFLEIGDSGSPVYAKWVNPNGQPELALLGNHVSYTSLLNRHNFVATTPVMTALNAKMNVDGFALKVVGNPTVTWNGATDTSLTSKTPWLPIRKSAPTDTFVLFDGGSVTNHAVVSSVASKQRGLYFVGHPGEDGFSFTGAGVLSLGRGGLTNYDDSRQVLGLPLALLSSQYWNTGEGGVTTGAIALGANLLEVQGGSAANEFTGVLSGTGGLAITTGTTRLTATNTYTGGTWVHSGRLLVDGSLASPTVTTALDGVLGGTGRVGTILGSGTAAPGTGPGALTAAAVNPTSGLDFAFEFTAAGAPVTPGTTTVVNDVLRLTGATPFTTALSTAAGNIVHLYLDVAAINAGDTFQGGFFTQTGSLAAAVTGATYIVYVADPLGPITHGGKTYRPYSGPLAFSVGTAAQTLNFGDGLVAGDVLAITAVP